MKPAISTDEVITQGDEYLRAKSGELDGTGVPDRRVDDPDGVAEKKRRSPDATPPAGTEEGTRSTRG